MRLKYYSIDGFAAIGNSKYVRILIKRNKESNLKAHYNELWHPFESTREKVKKQIYLLKKSKLEQL